jgi:hypothetical protein
MKFSVIAATVATASAHRGHHYKHSTLPHHPIYHYVKNLISPAEPKPFHCDYDGSQDMEQWEYMLNIKRSVYVNGVRGFYQDKIVNDISDKCMSNDIMTKFDGIKALHHKIITGDFFEITMDEHKSAINDMIEAVWSTIEDCRLVVPLQDVISWCENNTDKCVHKTDLLARLYDNAIEIFEAFFDMYNIVTRDTMCENNVTTVQNWGKMSYDIAQVYSKQLGFDVALDTKKEVSHESLKVQINHVVDAAAATWPAHPTCPFRPLYETLKTIKTYIKDEVHDDLHSIHHFVKDEVHHIKDHFAKKVEKFETHFNHGIEQITNTFSPPVPDFKVPEIQYFEVPQIGMPQFEMPQFDFGMPQQTIWAQPPQAFFGMPEMHFESPRFNLF